MNEKDEEEFHVLFARVRDLCARAQYAWAYTSFLTPREARHVLSYLRELGEADRVRFFGGYAAAERVCLWIFPPFVTEMADGRDLADSTIDELLTAVGEESPVRALHIRGSGYRTLTHRDYLGSLLSLGVEREVLGDILVEDDHAATVLVMEGMASYLEETLTRVANDAVKVEEVPLPREEDIVLRVMPLHDTVASARLDCVVAALGNLSREAAQKAIREGLVELEYENETRVDRLVAPPCILSCRGIGKFRVTEIGDMNRRGRLRLSAEKYL